MKMSNQLKPLRRLNKLYEEMRPLREAYLNDDFSTDEYFKHIKPLIEEIKQLTRELDEDE